MYRPKATTLYALNVPQGPAQIVRYDDGTGDELPVPLGTTVCKYSSKVNVSGQLIAPSYLAVLQSLLASTLLTPYHQHSSLLRFVLAFDILLTLTSGWPPPVRSRLDLVLSQKVSSYL